MKKLTILLITLSFFTFFIFFTSTPTPEQEVDFFNTSFLRNTTAVQKALIKEGFIEIDYITPDDLQINAFMLDQSNTKTIKGTIICASGFFPGNKEGISTLYPMLKEQPYNLIFFDARGHGKSTGDHMTYQGIKNYTKHEYQDIIGTINFIQKYNQSKQLPNNIVLYGLCSGAFHSIKAITELQKQGESTSHINGVIFDSGWPSFVEVVEPSLKSEIAKRFNHWSTYLIGQLAQTTLILTYQLLFKPHHKSHPSIIDEIQNISQPIFFIHAKNDSYIPLELVDDLIKKSQNPTTWIIDQSTHACHHLKHKEAYQEKMICFLNNLFIT